MYRNLVACIPLLALVSCNTMKAPVRIVTLGELQTVCAPLIKAAQLEANSKRECLTFFEGVLAGYYGTVAISAEYELAASLGESRNSIAARIDTDIPVHEKLTGISHANQFICIPTNIPAEVVASSALENIAWKSLSLDKPAYYYLTDSLQATFSC